MSAAILRFEAKPAPATGQRPGRLQRGDGAAEIGFARRHGRSSLADLYQRTPCRVLFPRVEPDEPPVAVLLTTSGGLTGGDRLRIAITVGEDAAAVVTTQAAEKIYRSLGTSCTVAVALSVAAGGWLEYLPQETILFDGARLERRTSATLAAGARLLACEMVVFGRTAREESFTHGLLHEAWRVRRDGRLVWADTLRLDDDVAAALAAPAGFGGARALATALYVGACDDDLVATARGLAEGGGSRGGVSLVNSLLIARFLGEPGVVRADLMRYIAGLRAAAAGLAATLPRVWHS